MIDINQSCDPHCEAVITGPWIYVPSLQTRQPGEELLYDYPYARTSENDEELDKFYPCLGGAATSWHDHVASEVPAKSCELNTSEAYQSLTKE